MIKVKKEYYDNGNIKFEYYFINGMKHREDGPALIYYNIDGNIWSKSYWLEGELLTKEEWFNQLSVENKLKFAFGIDND